MLKDYQAQPDLEDALYDCNGYELLGSCDVGAGMVKVWPFPEVSSVYAYESFSGSGLGHSFCFTQEAGVGRLIAIARALEWLDRL